MLLKKNTVVVGMVEDAHAVATSKKMSSESKKKGKQLEKSKKLLSDFNIKKNIHCFINSFEKN